MGSCSAHPKSILQLFSLTQVKIVISFDKAQAQAQAYRQLLDPNCEEHIEHGADSTKVIHI